MKSLQKTDQVKLQIADAFNVSPVVCSVPEELRDGLLERGECSSWEPGELIFREGSDGTDLFFIFSGRASVFRSDPMGRELELTQFGAGDFFGELNIFSNCSRTASVKAVEATSLLLLSREALLAVFEPSSVFEKIVAEIAQRIASFNSRYVEVLREQQEAELRMSKLANLGELVADIGHEINTPLQFLCNTFYLLRQSLSEAEKSLSGLQDADGVELAQAMHLQREFLRDVSQKLETCQAYTDDVATILANMNTYAYQNVTKVHEVDICDGIESMLTLLSQDFRQRVTLVRDFQKLPSLTCNASQINQVFLNLLSNAVKAIQGRGEVRISASLENEEICVRITDSGCGIPVEQQSRVFERYFTTRAEGEGTGLGLAIAKRIVEDHKGTLQLTESQPGKTTFAVRLPLENGMG